MRRVDSAGFDAAVVQAPGDDLRCVFLWGQDCYNCNIFKQTALLHRDALLELDLSWFEADVYADEPLGRRFRCMACPPSCCTGRASGWDASPAGRACPSSRRRSAGCVSRLRKIPLGRLENPAGGPSYAGTVNFLYFHRYTFKVNPP